MYNILRFVVFYICCSLIKTCSNSKPSNYDISTALFDPSGRILQLDNAFKASYKGETLLVVSSNDFIVIITLKKIDSNMIVKIPSKLHRLSNTIGITGTGIVSDINYLSQITFKEVTKMKMNGLYPHIGRISASLAHHIQKKTMTSFDRPYGVSLCLFSYDTLSSETNLYTIDSIGNIQKKDLVILGDDNKELKKYCDNLKYHNLKNKHLNDIMNQCFDSIQKFLHNENKEDHKLILEDYLDQDKITVHIVGKDIPLRLINPSTLKSIIHSNYQNIEKYLL